MVPQAALPERYHPRLIEAAIALNENRLDIAERLLKPHLKDDPFDPAAIRMLAELAARIGRMRDAESLLRRAVELAPGWTAPKANLALVLGRMGRPAEAMDLLDELVAVEPESVGHWNLRAATLGRLGDFEEAIGLYEAVLAQTPNQPQDLDELRPHAENHRAARDGIAAYRKAIELSPMLGEAWWSLANLKTVKFDEPTSRRCEKALGESALSDEDRLHLEFALGKAMHDAGRFDDAFDHYARGNALRLKLQPYAMNETGRSVDRSIAVFTPQALNERRGGCEAPDPIFIVGMPRAGSTLIEQICRRTPWSRARPSCPTFPRWRGKRGNYPKSVLDLTEAHGGLGRGISETNLGPATDRQAVLRRQAAEQLDVRALYPSHPAQRQNH